MAIQIPSLLELAQNALTPKFLKNINTEHQIVKTAESTKELVEINRRLSVNQVQLATRSLESQLKLETSWRDTNSHLVGLRADLTVIRNALEDFSVASLRGLARINSTLTQGIGLIEASLRQIIALHIEETQLLGEISVLLSKPYEVRILELRQRADQLFQNSLRKSNENQTKNLQTCLAIYQKITEDIVGQLDYLVWFQIGWLNWQLMDDPAAAREAFDEAQRLSDGAGNNEAFRAKSLRHLARMHFLLSDFEEARITIGRALSIRANDSHALHDAALYAALAGRKNEAHGYFSLALKHDPLLYLSTQLDPDFDQVEITPELLDSELHTQLDRVSHLLRKMDVFFTNILPVWDKMSASVPPTIQLFISTRSAAHENAAVAGYLTLRQLEIDMAQATGVALLKTRRALVNRMKEVREDLDQIEQRKLAAMEYPRREAERVERIYQKQRTDAIAEAKVKAPHPDDLNFDWFADLLGEIFTKLGCLAWPASIIGFICLVQVLNEKTNGWLLAAFFAVLITCLGMLAIVMVVHFIYSMFYNIAERLKKVPLDKRLEALRSEHDYKVSGMAKEPHPNILAQIEIELHDCVESLALYTECQKQINELRRAPGRLS